MLVLLVVYVSVTCPPATWSWRGHCQARSREVTTPVRWTASLGQGITRSSPSHWWCPWRLLVSASWWVVHYISTNSLLYLSFSSMSYVLIIVYSDLMLFFKIGFIGEKQGHSFRTLNLALYFRRATFTTRRWNWKHRTPWSTICNNSWWTSSSSILD